jgi:homoserine dehydrogenase
MKQYSLIIFGAGKVGRALVRQLREADAYHIERHGVRFSVNAWCDREGALVDERGIRPGVLDRAIDAKAAGAPFAEMEEGYRQNSLTGIVDVAGRDDTILVDVSATDATVPALEMGLGRGYAAATANKIPLTLGQDVFDRLTAGARLRYESTVGSAVPVIEATLGLVAAADRVDMVQGALSGTLGFLCTGLQAGQPFSALVREAMARGYTEPDPRIDLGGVDVARKALILSRTLGWRMELADIQVESLVPPHLAALGLDEFLARLPELDVDYARQVNGAGTEGKVLRYVAELKDGSACVGMQAAPITTALGRLQGNDNLVAFHTRYYPDTPLVLQGRGAGVEAAAAGVHADIVALATAAGHKE